MNRIIKILFLIIIVTDCYSQRLISKDNAIKIAINTGIKNPLDSFIVVLKNDTIWKVQSLYCDDYYGTKSEIFSINAITGEKLNLFGMSQSMKWHSHPRPRTEISSDFVDSLIEINKSLPKQLLPDYFEHESEPRISQDNRWIAFDCGFRTIAIASTDGRKYRKICDSCLYPEWTEKENTLIYEKNFQKFYLHNIETNEIYPLTNNQYRYLYFTYCPNGKWISYVKSVPRESDNPNEIIMCMEDQCYELFVKSIMGGNEKRITFEGSVSSPVWNRAGDTIFFYLDHNPYFATDFDLDRPVYGRATHLDKINVWDYSNIVDNKFVYKFDCQLMLINASTLKPEKYIIKKRDRYENIELSDDGKLIVYTIKKQGKEKIYIIEN
jgi:Tol biopolymer transport system component